MQVDLERPVRAKKIAYPLSSILFFSLLVYTGSGAGQTNSVSFHGIGVAIDLTFPLDAHPTDTITHNMTITATADVALQNITLFVYAPVGPTLQKINSSYVSLPLLQAGTSLPTPVRVVLPQNANGTLFCLLHVKTDQSSDYASATFYTTQVRSVSYGELLAEYGALLANYSNLLDDYENLIEEYDGLLSENVALISNQEALLNEYNAVKANYSSLLTSDAALQDEYNVKKASYEGLLADFNTLQENYTSLQEDYGNLEDEVGNLEQQVGDLTNPLGIEKVVILILIITVAGLIVLIAYIKRKRQEPYLVIRKEAIGVKKEENQ